LKKISKKYYATNTNSKKVLDMKPQSEYNL
jgi:hypothetical protein